MKNSILKTVMTLALLLSSSLWAAPTDDIKEMMTGKIAEITKILKNKNLSNSDRDTKIVNSINTIFDFNLMAKISLGKKNWAKLSSSKKHEFAHLFTQKFQRSYLNKLLLYTDETVNIDNAKQIKKSRIVLNTTIVSQTDEHKMIYKFYKSKKENKWLVYDLDLVGVSLIQTYRSQFNEVLKDNTIDFLMNKIKTSEI